MTASLSVFAAAAEAPHRPALITDDETVSYDELARRTRRVIRQLRTRSLDGPEPVALIAERNAATLTTLHALIALGTPALLLHPRHTPAERESLTKAAGAAGTVDPESLLAPDVVARKPDEDADPAEAPDSKSKSKSKSNDDRPLAIIPTSGTTGRPRAAVLSRRAFAASAAASAANLGWHDDDRWLLPLPLAHVGGLSIVTRCLLARRTVVLADGSDPERLLDAVRRHRVTLLSIVPTLLVRILDLDPAPAPPEHLRAILLGGAATSPALLERAADRRWPVLTTYGLTEACSQVTTQPYGTTNRGQLGSGPPLPGIQLRIGDDGGIQVRGPTLFSSYVPAPESSPFLDDDWFPTGDRGRLDDDGNLHVLGRRTDRIITGGENVDPQEVEQGLERLPGVREACVFGLPDAEWGEVVCAAVVLDREATAPGSQTLGPRGTGETGETWGRAEADVAEAVRALRAEMTPFKLPRHLAFLPTLPRNATGKVDRQETAARARPHLHPAPPVDGKQ